MWSKILAQITLPLVSFSLSVVYLAVSQSLTLPVVIWILTSLSLDTLIRVLRLKVEAMAAEKFKKIDDEVGKLRAESTRLNLLLGMMNSGRGGGVADGLRGLGVNEP